jgi:RNA polymerase sigma-70 factor (ECF subfamily)
MTDAADHEPRIRTRFDAGDIKGAATALLEAYGREVLGFLVARLREREIAGEVFSQFTEELWKSFGTFRWQCSARTWAYMLARQAASRHVHEARRRHRRELSLSHAGPLSAIAEKIRTATFATGRVEAHQRAVKLRERLPVNDQMLIILRVNRRLEWNEIARVMAKGGDAISEARLSTEAARLRKRYQLAKDKLRRMAIEEGLVPPDRIR